MYVLQPYFILEQFDVQTPRFKFAVVISMLI